MSTSRFGPGREADSRAAEARLDALFRTGWIPPEPGGPDPAGRDPGEVTERAAPTAGAPAGGSSGSAAAQPRAGGAPEGSDLRARALAWRLDPGRRGAAAVLIAALIAAAAVGWRVLSDRPQARAVAVSAELVRSAGSGGAVAPGSAGSGGSGASGGSAGSGAPASSIARVVVDVIGKVRRPGLLRLPTGSRVDDAVRGAGGAVPGTDLSSLNLARVVIDGEQIAVGVTGAAGSVPGSVTTGSGSSGGSGVIGPGALVNLNTATVAQLDSALPGVGPVLAQRIVDWRTAHGRFDSVDQLNQVTGVGDAKFSDLKALVTV